MSEPKIRLGVISSTPFLDALPIGAEVKLYSNHCDDGAFIPGILVAADALGAIVQQETGCAFVPWTQVRHLWWKGGTL